MNLTDLQEVLIQFPSIIVISFFGIMSTILFHQTKIIIFLIIANVLFIYMLSTIYLKNKLIKRNRLL